MLALYNAEGFLARRPVQKCIVMRIYRVAGCKTEIEISESARRLRAHRCRASTRAVARIAGSASRSAPTSERRASFLDPWVRKVKGEKFFCLGNATNFRLIVLYKPDCRLGQVLGLTLLHEWLHLVAFASTIHIWRFQRANTIEPLPSAGVRAVEFRRPRYSDLRGLV